MTPWVSWERIAVPQGLGGWGLKKIFLFAKALVSKGGWILLKSDSLWTRDLVQKYISPESVEDWIRRTIKSHTGGSFIWKAVVKSFDVTEDSLA